MRLGSVMFELGKVVVVVECWPNTVGPTLLGYTKEW